MNAPAKLTMDLNARRNAVALELRPAGNPDQVEPSHVLPFKGRTFKQAVNRLSQAGFSASEWEVRFVYNQPRGFTGCGHTPTPWHLEETAFNQSALLWVAYVFEGVRMVARVYGDTEQAAKDSANAAIIGRNAHAALVALKEAVFSMGYASVPHIQTAYLAAEKALKEGK